MKPFEIADVKRISQAVRRGIDKRARRSVSDELPSPPVYTSDINLVGVSAAFVEVMKLVGRVASPKLSAFITRETGPGKENVARAAPCRRPPADKPVLGGRFCGMPALAFST